jgi:hypothetical protein
MATEKRVTCRVCHERPATPSRVKNYDYRCTRCIHRSPAGAARLARYNASGARKAVMKRSNDRRIHIGRAYHSTAPTAAEAARINAHIKEQRLAFVKRQQNREEAQGAAAR